MYGDIECSEALQTIWLLPIPQGASTEHNSRLIWKRVWTAWSERLLQISGIGDWDPGHSFGAGRAHNAIERETVSQYLSLELYLHTEYTSHPRKFQVFKRPSPRNCRNSCLEAIWRRGQFKVWSAISLYLRERTTSSLLLMAQSLVSTRHYGRLPSVCLQWIPSSQHWSLAPGRPI